MRAPVPSHAARIRSPARQMRDGKRGVAAIEFAIISTVLLVATLGFFETVLAVRAKMLLSSSVASMAEMLGAESGIPPLTQTIMNDYCKGVRLTMGAYTTTSLSMAVASVTFAAGSKGPARDWEYDGACPTTAGALGSSGAMSLTSSMTSNSGDSVIVIQASYTYVPVINTVLPSMTFTQTVFAHPRYNRVYCINC